MIQAAQAVLSDDQYWQPHLHCQIFDEIIRMYGHHPASDTFDQNTVNACSQHPKRIEQTFDLDLDVFSLGCGQRRGRRLQPKRVDLVYCQTGRARGSQKFGVPAVATANWFESGA